MTGWTHGWTLGWTLGWYFFRYYIKITFYFLIGIFCLALMLDFTENSSRLTALPAYTISGAFLISLLRLPSIMLQILPFIVLFSSITTLFSLNRHSELVIARSAGISAWQFLLPIFIGSFLLGIAAIFILNPLSAWSMSRAKTIIADWRTPTDLPLPDHARIHWLTQYTDEGKTTIGAKMVLNRGLTLMDATFIRFRDDQTIRDWLNCETASLEQGFWLLNNIVRYRTGYPPEEITQMRIATQLQPAFVEERLADPTTVSFYELPHKIKIVHSFGYSAHKFSMHLHSIIALPAFLVAMTLIAATVSLRFMRSGQSGMMILGGVVFGFIFYVVTVLVQAFGSIGSLPPILAAWVPIWIVLFFGISFLLHKEDG